MKFITNVSISITVGFISIVIGNITEAFWLCGWIGGCIAMALLDLKNNYEN